eukprot:COSAG02_NODE_16755_length_1058_cov_0.885297_2_plen_282_part_01
MRCIECDVAQHLCCLTPARLTKPDHWCCRSCSHRLQSELIYLVDDVDVAKPKRKHRRTKGAVLDVNYTRSAEGKYGCNNCGREYETESAVKGHCTKGCDGGDWKCTWCGSSGATGKEDGPDGSATLCAACHSRYSSGVKAPAKREAETFVCDICGQRCATMISLAAHMRGCDGGQWRCKWCKTEAHGQMAGPDGPSTLCNFCGSVFRIGYVRTCPRAEGAGVVLGFLCRRGCRKQFGSMEGLLAHQCVCTGSSVQCDWCAAQAEKQTHPPHSSKHSVVEQHT